MKKVYYELIDGKYVPALEYDSNLLDAMGKGSHLVMCYPGSKIRHYNIEPALAPMIAASQFAEDAMCQAMLRASNLKPAKPLLTPEQRAAWDNLARELGDERATLTGSSVRDIVAAGIKALIETTEELMANSATKQAYEEFLLIARLTKEQND